MNEATIRSRLHAAFGESTYPPDLARRAAARLGEPDDQLQHPWVLGILAAVLAIALVATILFGTRAFRQHSSVPVKPPSVQAPALTSCPTFSQLNQPLLSITMTSPTTGWAAGGLRTTDAGAHWRDLTPSLIRADMPSAAISNGLYPPGFKDFYLDSTHGWEYRTYASSTSCADHAEVLSTADGGRTWRQSKAISFGLPPGWGATTLDLQFIDARQGWLWIELGPIQYTGFGRLAAAQEGVLYRTVDGGTTWRLVSTLKPSELGFKPSQDCPFALGDATFASSTAGWMVIQCPTATPELLATADGGATWMIRRLPSPTAPTKCPCMTLMPHVFNSTHAVVEIDGNYADLNPMIPTAPRLDATSDGGMTWQAVPAGPSTGFTFAMDFVDQKDWWAVISAPGWQKGQPTNDWLYSTTDGGQNWTLVQTGVPMGYPPPDLVFIDALHGLAAQEQNAAKGLPIGPGFEVLTTSDGGHTWRSVVAQLGP